MLYFFHHFSKFVSGKGLTEMSSKQVIFGWEKLQTGQMDLQGLKNTRREVKIPSSKQTLNILYGFTQHSFPHP